MKFYLSLISSILVSIISTLTYAANPASKEYVDQRAASLQTQINALKNSGLQIGQYYQGGVIFYLDSSQSMGLLVAINDANYSLSSGCTTTATSDSTGPYGGCFWWNGSGGSAATGAEEINYFTGQSNTETILAINSTPTVYPAAYVANQYSTSQDPPGAYWYLPSEGETNKLMLAINNSSQINATIAAHGGQTLPLLNGGLWLYWSSTEYALAITEAMLVPFNDGSIEFVNKDAFQAGVRPIRAFSY